MDQLWFIQCFVSIHFRRFSTLTLKGDNDLACMASTPSTLISMLIEVNSLPGTQGKTAITNLVAQRVGESTRMFKRKQKWGTGLSETFRFPKRSSLLALDLLECSHSVPSKTTTSKERSRKATLTDKMLENENKKNAATCYVHPGVQTTCLDMTWHVIITLHGMQKGAISVPSSRNWIKRHISREMVSETRMKGFVQSYQLLELTNFVESNLTSAQMG